jgi:hypothetical protein
MNDKVKDALIAVVQAAFVAAATVAATKLTEKALASTIVKPKRVRK